jgi:hypothetical protein
MDYAALAKQYGGTTAAPAVDYAALAKQYGGTSAMQSTEVPMERRSYNLADVPAAAASNVVESGGKFLSGIYEAVTNPVQTVTGLLDLGAGALQNVLPKRVVDFVNQFDANPQAAQRAVETANAVGGIYKDRYGSYEGIKRTFAEDPVGAVSDLSTLLSGGAAATARVAPAASKALATAATFTNPAAPIAKAAEYGIGMAAKGTGNVIDSLSGRKAEVRAGNIVRNALTEEGRTPQNLLAAQMALQNAPAGATVRQSLADIMSPQTQYLGQMVEAQTAPGRAETVRQTQQANRLGMLQANTPDLQTAEALRANAAGPLYAAATQPTLAVTTAPMVQNIDNILAANPGNTKLVSALNQVKSGLEASTNAQQVSSVLDNLKDLIASKDNKFIVSNLIDVKNGIEKTLPGYSAAQKVFASTSGPVNQAKVLNAMQDVLAQPLGVGERAGPFMTAMGRGEGALLKKATGTPRFSELSDVLTPGQMKVVGEVESGLLRDANVAAQTKAGAEAMKIIMDANKSSFKLPDFMSVKVTLANQMLGILEGRISKKVLGELEKGFQSNTSFVDLMKKVPASERIEVLRALGQAKDQLSPTKLNVYTQVQNALAPQSENQNAMVK